MNWKQTRGTRSAAPARQGWAEAQHAGERRSAVEPAGGRKRHLSPGRWGTGLACLCILLGLISAPAPVHAQAGRMGEAADPRVGLAPGWMDAGEAARNMELLASQPRPEGFHDPEAIGDLLLANSDLAFRGDFVFVGNFRGWMIYDVSDPQNPALRTSVLCPGGQGDVSVHGDLLFMSVEMPNGRIDCGTEGAPGEVNPDRFRGVRIFDISDLDAPRQVAAVQTCRGSHTHSILDDADDPDHLYVYVSGAAGVRPEAELAGCVAAGPDVDPDATALFRIEVIRVPLDAPEEAHVASQPRVFADHATGDIAALWEGGDHGEGTQRTSQTNHCHDITIYPEIGLAAGACSGNGILLDISDPVNPVRIDEVVDPNFAYWHSATFNNDGTAVIFTDEWGGGTSPRCQATDPPEWGANAIFRIVDGRMEHRSYYKLPPPQTRTENCVAHNGSLVPVPGRDIKVQAWYQGGISVLDFTDPDAPFEIAFFDRGPLSETELLTGGHWSAYWYNGYIYGSEIARGLDVLTLLPSEHLSENELEAARLVRFEEFNPQHQPRMVWPPDFVVARAHYDQMVRQGALSGNRAIQVAAEFDRIERMRDGPQKRAALSELATELWSDAREAEGRDAELLRTLAGALLDVATTMR